MATTKEQIRAELKKLISKGIAIHNSEFNDHNKTRHKKKDSNEDEVPIVISYQEWYTQALPVVRQLLPERYTEFQEQYKIEKRKEITYLTYTISDYLIGLQVKRGEQEMVDTRGAFSTKFQNQIFILRSSLSRLDSILSDIRNVLQAEFFDDELSVAKDLLTKGHLRAAGAVTGVTLERHLKHVAVSHSLTLRKLDPTIADLNESLKSGNVIDVPDWRFIQRMADIRNLCVHSKGREPTKDEVDELIRGTEKLVKTLS